MIHDGLSAIGRYRGLYKGLDVLIDWLAEADVASLPTGRLEICGNKVYALVQDARTRTYEEARYEVHRRYMDVQVDLVGVERFMVTPGETIPAGDFDEAADKGYCHAALTNDDEIEGSLEKGRFALFVIGEPHMPNLVPAGQEVGPIHKVCFKVLGDEFWDDRP